MSLEESGITFLEKEISELETILKDMDPIMVRAVEDLISLLIKKEVIAKEDLHPNIFKNIQTRDWVRASIRELTELKNTITEENKEVEKC